MCSVAKPIIKQIRDNREALDFFETVSLPAEDEKTQAIIMNFPTVYIHNWQDSGAFEVYVGETNNNARYRESLNALYDERRACETCI